MQSVMVTVQAKRLTVYREGWAQRASGEACTHYYTVRRTGERPRKGGRGILIRLDDYRAGYTGAPAEEEQNKQEPRPAQPGYREERAGRERLGLLLECVATVAIVAMALGTLLCFFAL